MLKKSFRTFVVWSSRSPLGVLYQFVYWLIVQLVLLSFSRCKSIRAIYVCRGFAKRSIVPGISDIDIAIFIANDSLEQQKIQGIFQRWKQCTLGLVDYYPSLVATVQDLEYRRNAAPAWQYRYHEGKRTWVLLQGEDLLARLAPLSEAKRKAACYIEMQRWWLLFSQSLALQKVDILQRNVTCFKAVSELLSLEAELFYGVIFDSRVTALDKAQTPLTTKLVKLHRENYLIFDSTVYQETYDFLVQFFSSLWERFQNNPFLLVQEGISQQVDAPHSEFQISKPLQNYISNFESYVRNHLGRIPFKINIVKSAFWEVDDVLCMVQVPAKNLPTVQELQSVVDRFLQGGPAITDNAFLFLLVGSLAFPLTPRIPRDYHRGVLTPATFPDVFLALGEHKVFWTDYVQWYLLDWQANQQWNGASDSKCKQLAEISQSQLRGDVIFPLTHAAISRRQ